MTYGMKGTNGQDIPKYSDFDASLKPSKADLVHAIEWHRRRRSLGEYMLDYNLEYEEYTSILSELTDNTGEDEASTFEFDAEEVQFLENEVNWLASNTNRPRPNDCVVWIGRV